METLQFFKIIFFISTWNVSFVFIFVLYLIFYPIYHHLLWQVDKKIKPVFRIIALFGRSIDIATFFFIGGYSDPDMGIISVWKQGCSDRQCRRPSRCFNVNIVNSIFGGHRPTLVSLHHNNFPWYRWVMVLVMDL